MKYAIFLILMLCGLQSFGQQQKTVLVYDLINSTLDSLPLVSFDSTVQSDMTLHNLGSFNNQTANLEQNPPTQNVFAGTEFTRKERAAIPYDLTQFPLRTSVKTFFVENDTLKGNCSGSLISRRHVLTANHCMMDFNSITLFSDSIFVSPAYNNGVFSSDFNFSFVSKVYFFRDWEIAGEDFAVLELEDPIGQSTGWLGIGFEEVDSLLLEGIFYKFSYPNITWLAIDSNEYNGDTMYYNYGVADVVDDYFIGVDGTIGIPGESGSSLIKVVNGQQYTSYGALSYANQLRHSKISDWTFYAIEDIIKDELVLEVNEESLEFNLVVHPNPVSGWLQIQHGPEVKVNGMTLYDQLGRKVIEVDDVNSNPRLDLTELPEGAYLLRIETNQGNQVKKVVRKRGR